MVVLISAYYTIQTGNYPIAYVDGNFVLRNDYEASLESALHYYDVLNTGLNIKDDENFLRKGLPDLKMALLDKMVMDKLILNRLKNILGSDLFRMTEDKITSAIKQAPSINSVASLYGLNLPDFKKIVLEPQARLELLEGRFDIDKKDFTSWSKEARVNAKVYVFAAGLKWDGEKVSLK